MRKLAPIKSKLLLIFLTATISACAGAPQFPDVPLYETAYSNGVWTCGEYKVSDPIRKKFSYVRDWPLEKCIGVFGFSKADFPKILDWSDKMEKYYKDQLNKCGGK